MIFLDFFNNLWADEGGQGMVEYGLILALIAIVVIAALTLIGTNLKGKYEQINNSLQGP